MPRFSNRYLDALRKFKVSQQPVFEGHLHLISSIAKLILSGTPENTIPLDATQLDVTCSGQASTNYGITDKAAILAVHYAIAGTCNVEAWSTMEATHSTV
jgi:hypothetical protein